MVSRRPKYRNSTMTKRLVANALSYPCQAIGNCEALNNHSVDQVVNATTTNDALLQICSKQCGDIHTPGLRSSLLSILSDPNVNGILFLIGTFAMFADVYNPPVLISIVVAAAIALAAL